MNYISSYFNPVPKEESLSVVSNAMKKVMGKIPKHDRIPEQVTRLALNGIQFIDLARSGLSNSGLISRSLLRSSLIPLIWLEFPAKVIELEKSAASLRGSFEEGTWKDVSNRSFEVFTRAIASVGTVTETVKLFSKENILVIGATQSLVLTGIGVVATSIMLLNSVSEVKKQTRELVVERRGSPKFNVALLKTVSKVAAVAFAALFLATFIIPGLSAVLALLIISTIMGVFSLAAAVYEKTVEV